MKRILITVIWAAVICAAVSIVSYGVRGAIQKRAQQDAQRDAGSAWAPERLPSHPVLTLEFNSTYQDLKVPTTMHIPDHRGTFTYHFKTGDSVVPFSARTHEGNLIFTVQLPGQPAQEVVFSALDLAAMRGW